MYKSEVYEAIRRIYKATPDTMWPREAFELSLLFCGLAVEVHKQVMTELEVYPEDQEWWLEQLGDLQKMIDGDLKSFPWLELD